MKHRKSADRARHFCVALAAESEGRRAVPWWSSIDTISRRLDMAYDETAELARACADAGYVTRDQSKFRHIVTLNQTGRELVMGKGR
jgi:hypothetical protein